MTDDQQRNEQDTFKRDRYSLLVSLVCMFLGWILLSLDSERLQQRYPITLSVTILMAFTSIYYAAKLIKNYIERKRRGK